MAEPPRGTPDWRVGLGVLETRRATGPFRAPVARGASAWRVCQRVALGKDAVFSLILLSGPLPCSHGDPSGHPRSARDRGARLAGDCRHVSADGWADSVAVPPPRAV